MAGAATVVVCVLLAVWTAGHVLNRGVPVLAVSHAVPAGSVLAAADLSEVVLPATPGVATVPASRRGEVVGATVAVPLSAGSLLSAADLGPSRWPPPGQAIVPVGLAAGALPPGVQVGARVAVLPGTSPGQSAASAPTSGNPVVGLVTALTAQPTSSGMSTVASLLVPTSSAAAVAAIGAPVLVVLDPGGQDAP